MEIFEVAFINDCEDGILGNSIYATVAANRDSAIAQVTAELIGEDYDVTGCRVIVRPFKP